MLPDQACPICGTEINDGYYYIGEGDSYCENCREITFEFENKKRHQSGATDRCRIK